MHAPRTALVAAADRTLPQRKQPWGGSYANHANCSDRTLCPVPCALCPVQCAVRPRASR